MIHLTIPSDADVVLAHLVCDVNGTLAVDGQVPDTVYERLSRLSRHLQIHLVSADTFGMLTQITQRLQTAATPVQVQRIATGAEKATYVTALGAELVVALGNGKNDAAMFAHAALSMAINGSEGLATAAALAATLIVPSVEVALDLLLQPQRLMATLRL